MSGQTVVAIIDENQAVREATESLLRAYGFHLQCFSTIEEFFARRNAEQLACVILMPNPAEYPVVSCSGA
jgi:FixJ family two-component response regulator